MAPYRSPQLLADIDLLDLLELAGSTVRAAPLLRLSQPTVSRRRRRLVQELGLAATPDLTQGDGACLRLLRRAAQCHRLEAGVWRLGGDGWCLDPAMHPATVLAVPQRFAPLSHWQGLVEGHVLDGAVISGHGLRMVAAGIDPSPEGWIPWLSFLAVPLVEVPVTLLARRDPSASTARPGGPWQQVQMPALSSCSALATEVRQRQLLPIHRDRAGSDPGHWLDLLAPAGARTLATPLWQRQLQRCSKEPLQAIALPRPLRTDLWLLVQRRLWERQPILQQLVAQHVRSISECIGEA
jgi:hypothetical protein